MSTEYRMMVSAIEHLKEDNEAFAKALEHELGLIGIDNVDEVISAIYEAAATADDAEEE